MESGMIFFYLGLRDGYAVHPVTDSFCHDEIASCVIYMEIRLSFVFSLLDDDIIQYFMDRGNREIRRGRVWGIVTM